MDTFLAGNATVVEPRVSRRILADAANVPGTHGIGSARSLCFLGGGHPTSAIVADSHPMTKPKKTGTMLSNRLDGPASRR
jgi:hypothetical protein